MPHRGSREDHLVRMEGGRRYWRRTVVKERGGERLKGVEESAVDVEKGEGVCV